MNITKEFKINNNIRNKIMNEIKAEDQTLTYVALENVQFNNMSFEVAHQEQINDLCRTCLTSATSFQSIFETNLNKMAMELTSVQITQGDGLPSKICSDCVLQIKQAYIFKQRVENSDNILRQHCLYIERVEDVDEPKNRYSEVNYEQPSKVTNFGWDCNELLSIQLDSDDEVVNDFSEDNCNSDIENEEKDILKTIESSINTKEDGNNIENENLRANKEKCRDERENNISSICEKKLISLPSLKSHMKTHTDERLYICEIPNCNRSFKRSCVFQQHKQSHTDTGSKECDIDYIPSRNDSAIAGSADIVKTESPTQYQSNVSTGHRPITTGNNRMKNARSCLPSLKHMKAHTGAKPYQCEFTNCGKSFKCIGDLIGHKWVRHIGNKVVTDASTKNHICPICGKKSISLSALKRHTITHTDEKRYHCITCGKNYKSKCNLRRHKSLLIGNNQMENASSSLPSLKHIKTHTGEKPYKCEFTNCGKSFKYSRDLIRHKWVLHTGNKPMTDVSTNNRICLTCGKKSNSLSSFKRHMLSHTEERPYRCTKCGKNFKSRSNLRGHENLHTGNINLICSVCGKITTCASALRRHMMVHTGEKPHKCIKCSKCFRTMSELNVHQKVHGGILEGAKTKK